MFEQILYAVADSIATITLNRPEKLSPDAYEGVASFLEKRAPRFTMRPSRDMPDFFPWWPERPFA